MDDYVISNEHRRLDQPPVEIDDVAYGTAGTGVTSDL